MPTSTRASPNPARVALSPRDGYRFMMSVAGLSKNTKNDFLAYLRASFDWYCCADVLD
jgi:hypothetical protein